MKPIPAPIYNSIVNVFYSKRILKYIQDELQPRQELKVLDIPCGTGLLVKCCKPSWYVGADIDARRVVEAKSRHPFERFVVSDASSLIFMNDQFDRILVSGLFHHVSDAISSKILSELKRVLKPNGKLIVVEAIWPKKWYNFIGFAARKMDQGKFVRYEYEYEVLFRQYFKIEKKYCFSKFKLDFFLTTLIYEPSLG